MPFPELKSLIDDADNDSDKTFIVPSGEVYQLLWLWVAYIATATAGDRQLKLFIYDASDTIVLEAAMGDYITASETWMVLFAPGAPTSEDETTVDKHSLVTLPSEVLIPAGGYIRIFDKAAIAAAADDMQVRGVVKRHQPGVD